jgi:signal transduction histidine kinase
LTSTNIQARHGAGLGLAIAKAFVTLLSGEIWLESQEGIALLSFHITVEYKNKEQNYKQAFIRKLK